MKHSPFSLLVLCVLLTMSFGSWGVIPARAIPAIIRVTQSGTTTWPCGNTWAASCSLQTALGNAVDGNELWVAAGVYKPTTDTADQAATFQLKTNAAVYGGFDGSTDDERADRDPLTHLTILSGDIDNNDATSGGSYITETAAAIMGNNSTTVVTGANGATLDGFIITGGNADGSSYGEFYGGGMFNYLTSPTVMNTIFIGNSGVIGGGMYNGDNSPIITNVTFWGNSASNGYGGGMFNTGNSPVLTNVTFIGNHAQWGGGMEVEGASSLVLTNVTFSANSAGDGGGMYYYDSVITIRNSIFWGNTASGAGSQFHDEDLIPQPANISDSVVQGGYAGGTNIMTTDPRLGPIGNYGGFTPTIPLLPGSSAIDNANAAYCPPTDQRGMIRPQGNGCDIGAFEALWYSLYLPFIKR